MSLIQKRMLRLITEELELWNTTVETVVDILPLIQVITSII